MDSLVVSHRDTLRVTLLNDSKRVGVFIDHLGFFIFFNRSLFILIVMATQFLLLDVRPQNIFKVCNMILVALQNESLIMLSFRG